MFRQWYAVAGGARLRTRPLAIQLLGLPLVLARDAHGRPFALEDRCPHRHAPLSSGCVEHGQLRCPYHGWRFDHDGRLTEVPGLPADLQAPAIRASAFPVIEHDGLLWLRPSQEGEPAPSALVMDARPEHRRFLWQTRWQAHVLEAMENFLDPLHTHYLHPGLVRRGGARAPMQARLRCDPSGFVVDYQGQPQQSGLLYRLFESPRSQERACFALPGSARIEYGYVSGAAVHITLHFSPRDDTHTEVFASLHVQGRWAPRWAVRWLLWPFLHRVGEQDKRMLALQSWNKQRFDARGSASTPLDLVRAPLERWWLHGEVPHAAQSRTQALLL
ncbi:aromatic ring-hydroxylating dioxygenase subunit alpha [Pseudoxanthomonas sp. JBR18]|uniref:aromatic ring-hydroxylating oxygenase subunit alpha n=1 Tax=Pseudoxanthomonas sp. JBR18 TaxID=2969308 RepID=UPI0023050CF6|nr:aromatic ring-hydroxylating dioxygenase subunit alpha [Pseudoxanthomonas sp. JBR18]WCE05692.1 aromatic ring-hydroxylating dioxygenase subunit alpha [Pseudoxanthomonas sp. JBR18]